MSHEGKFDSGNNQYKRIQEMFCGNADKIKKFKERCDKCDMTENIMIPTLVKYCASHLQDRWGRLEIIICLLNYWSKFPLEHIVQFQKDTWDYSTLYAVSSKWLHNFSYNSSTEELRSQVNNIYYTFSESGAQGGIIMVKSMMYQMFFM